MKIRIPMTVVAVLALTIAIARPGDLNVAGNFNVASNLTANAVTLGGDTRTNWPSGSVASGVVDLSSPVLDFSQPGNLFRLTLTSHAAWSFNNHVAGRELTLQVTEDATGGWTNAWPADLVWSGGNPPTFPTSANGFGLVKIIDDGGRWLALGQGLDYRVPCTNNCSYALQFDGSQTYASTASTAGWNAGEMTVEFWIKTTLTDNRGMAAVSTWGYAANGEGWMIGWGGVGGQLYYGYIDSNGTGYGNGGGSVSATPVNDGNWHHVAVTFDNANLLASLYIDGTLDGTLPFSSALVLSGTTVPLYVASSYNPVYVSPITIDEVRVSSVVRYSSSFTPPTSFTVDSDTLGYWKFSEGGGTTVHDETGNYDLTLSGNPAPTWAEGR